MYTIDNVEFALTYPDKIQQAIIEKKADPDIQKAGGAGKTNRVSDPTAAKAMRELSDVDVVLVYYGCNMERKVKQPQKWVDVANATKDWFSGTIQEKIMEHRFKDVPDKRFETCSELGLSTSYYNQMLKEIFTVARAVALGKGLNVKKVKI